MAWYRDTGYKGQLISLGGIKGKPGAGLEVEPFGYTTLGLPGGQVREGNPKRAYFMVNNVGAGIARIGLGTADIIYLLPYQSFVIDSLMPWTGPIWASIVDVATTLSCFEAQIQVT